MSQLRLSKYVYALKRGVINTACLFFDYIFLSTKRKTLPLVEKKKKVLIIRIDAIGDFVIWSDCARAYREIYPAEQYELLLLGNVAWLPLAQEMGVFDHIIGINRKKLMLDFFYRFAMFKNLPSYEFETIIYHTYSREFGTGDLIVRHLCAKNKIGVTSDNAIDTFFWSGLGKRWYTNLLAPSVHNSHELLKNEALILALGLPTFKAGLPILPKMVNIKLFLNEHYYVIFPGARVGLRQWPAEKYVQLAARIHQKTGWTGVVCGSGEEYALAEQIVSESNVPMKNLAGQTSLNQLVALISQAEILIGNETSGIHIAVGVQTPSVCILGGGHFGRFVPYPLALASGSESVRFLPVAVHEQMPCFGCNWNCIYKVSKTEVVPCVENIAVVAVWKAVEKVLDTAV